MIFSNFKNQALFVLNFKWSKKLAGLSDDRTVSRQLAKHNWQ